MAYTPINWQTGDTITAEKMNKMDNGWSVSSTQLFSESVTTEDVGEANAGILTYSETISADVITVTFNGTDYVCEKHGEDNEYGASWSEAIGGLDFSEYPFQIYSGESNEIATEYAGTYSVAVSLNVTEVSTSFGTAVGEAIVVPSFIYEGGGFTCDMSGLEVFNAVKAKRCTYMMINDSLIYHVAEIAESAIAFTRIIIDNKVRLMTIWYGTDDEITSETTVYPT